MTTSPSTSTPSLEPVPPLSVHRHQPLSHDQQIRVQKIIHAAERRDWNVLADLAASPGGFIDDHIRRVVCMYGNDLEFPLSAPQLHLNPDTVIGPLVLGGDNAQSSSSGINWRDLPKHREEGQVELDVNRSFVYYPTGKCITVLLQRPRPHRHSRSTKTNISALKDESDERIDARKHELSDIITETLRRHPMLCYFQGYHDIVQVLLLVLGAETTPAAVARLSLLRIRDFMLPTMTGALSHLQLLPSILKAADPDLFQHLSQTAPFYFALPATLTLYAHEIQEYGDIARLFDYLLTNEAAASIYLYATVSRSIQNLLSTTKKKT
jgi:hypothetical protein